jgi:hypothetical protein
MKETTTRLLSWLPALVAQRVVVRYSRSAARSFSSRQSRTVPEMPPGWRMAHAAVRGATIAVIGILRGSGLLGRPRRRVSSSIAFALLTRSYHIGSAI